jgi:hypothetical protein
MSQTALFWPAFAQVALIVVVMLAMGRARARSMRAMRKTPDDVALNRASDWDDGATQAANNYKNQFEMPVLFLAAIAMALALRLSDQLLVILAWMFVATRVVHAYVHLTFNKTIVRALVWLVGVATVVMMWGVLAVRVANG